MRPSGGNRREPDPQIGRLLQQITDRTDELWLLGISLQELKIKDKQLFESQDFKAIRERCENILGLLQG